MNFECGFDKALFWEVLKPNNFGETDRMIDRTDGQNSREQ